MFLSQTTALHSLTYMLLVVFVFVGGDVLFKNFLVYKGGELDKEDKSSSNAIPAAVHCPVLLSCTCCYGSPQSFLQMLSAILLQYFSNYFSNYLEYCRCFPKASYKTSYWSFC